MEQKYKFSQVKKYLREQQKPIRFKGLVVATEKNPKDFIRNFFVYNASKDTVFHSEDSANALQTYETTGKRRSFGDIYRIASFYFPKLTVTSTYKTLLEMIGNGKALSAICQQTGLRVYRATKGTEKAYFNGVKTDEFTTDFTQFEEFKNCPEAAGAWAYNFKEDSIKFVHI